jgi:hypothetical protein
MKSYRSICAVVILGVSASAYAAEVENVSRIVSVGKFGANICRIKLQGANYAAACPTAVYQEAYFTCDSSEGKELLAIALTAYAADKTARVTSNACSIYGSSVANVVGIMLE